MPKKKSYKAFTLAEALITLGIIGVVAAITIPSIIQKTKDKETVTAVKKAYTMFSQALLRAIGDNGDVSGWDFGTYNTSDGALKVENYFKPYLNIAQDCGISGGCFPNKYFQISGIEDGVGDTFNSASSVFATAKLADGSLVAVWSGGSSNYGFIIVDINGLKGPNTYGKDTFWFHFDKKGVGPFWWNWQPSVSSGSECDKTATANDGNNGRYCTAWVLRNENLDYKYCSDLDWTTKTTCN